VKKREECAVNMSNCQGHFWEIEKKMGLGPIDLDTQGPMAQLLSTPSKPNCQAQSKLGPQNIQSPTEMGPRHIQSHIDK
jgi:hypothetical protein